MKRRKTMDEKTLIIEGYQPVKGLVQDGYQPSASTTQKGGQNVSVSIPVATITPPKGGTGETTLKKK
jgi:hypothetical protein